MKYFFKCICIIAFLSACSSCAVKHTKLSIVETNERWAIYEGSDKDGFFVFVKSGRDLNTSLSRLHCEKQPCTVGRLGEVYLVERPVVGAPATTSAAPNTIP